MDSITSSISKDLFQFWISNKPPDGDATNKHILFALTTLAFSFIIYFLNRITFRLKGDDYLKLKIYDFWALITWCLGAFLVSFILTFAEIINITIPSAVLVSFSWDKLFSEMSKKQNSKDNPNNLESES